MTKLPPRLMNFVQVIIHSVIDAYKFWGSVWITSLTIIQKNSLLKFQRLNFQKIRIDPSQTWLHFCRNCWPSLKRIHPEITLEFSDLFYPCTSKFNQLPSAWVLLVSLKFQKIFSRCAFFSRVLSSAGPRKMICSSVWDFSKEIAKNYYLNSKKEHQRFVRLLINSFQQQRLCCSQSQDNLVLIFCHQYKVRLYQVLSPIAEIRFHKN